MSPDEPGTAVAKNEAAVAHNNGSVAHQIIGEFLSALEKQDGYGDIAKSLGTAIFDGKPTEAAIRKALFGDSPL